MTRPDPDAAVSVPLSERLVETAARALWSSGIGATMPLDFAHLAEGTQIAYRADVGAILAAVLPLLADEIEAERRTTNMAKATYGGAAEYYATKIRSLAEAVRDA